MTPQPATLTRDARRAFLGRATHRLATLSPNQEFVGNGVRIRAKDVRRIVLRAVKSECGAL
jgi:hypothetical protein